MKTKFLMAGLAWLAISGAAQANDIAVDAGALPISPASPYAHLFVHDAASFSDTIDFIVPAGSLSSSVNALNVKLGPVDLFNIVGLQYSVWGGTSAMPTTPYGTFPGNNLSYDIGLTMPGAYHLLISGMSDGVAGGAYGVALVSGVPEPETLSMMLAGVGILGFMARRRKAGEQRPEGRPVCQT